MAAEKLDEKLSIAKTYELLKLFNNDQKISLYLDSEIYRETKIDVVEKNFVRLNLLDTNLSEFQVGKSYNFGFEYQGKNYTGSLMIDDLNGGIKAHLLQDLNVFQRREDFRVRPPDNESYYINVLWLGNSPTNIKMNFIDMSQGGMKMTLREGARLNLFKSEVRIKGNLICKDEVIEFSGIIKKPTAKSIGVQFEDLSAQTKNQIWREVMRWSRSYSKYR